jgi:transposase
MEERIPADHPLRPLRAMVDHALEALSPDFAALYAPLGRPSIAPERLLRALLLQILFTVRSERQVMEHLEYNLLYRWFVGLGMDEAVWDVTVFTKNRDRLLRGDIAQAFFTQVLAQARPLLSSEHFTVDGTLLEAWASVKSVVPLSEDDTPEAPSPPPATGSRNPTVNFHGTRRTNATHRSTTDPESRLFKKGHYREAKPSYMGHVLMENRHGLVVNAMVTQATGTAEREAALALTAAIPGASRRATRGADKGYDTEAFVADLRELAITPHVAQNTTRRRSAIDGRTTRHPGYAVSQRIRKRVEEVFGWLKTIGLLRKLRHRGRATVDWIFVLATAMYNLVRIRNIRQAAA